MVSFSRSSLARSKVCALVWRRGVATLTVCYCYVAGVLIIYLIAALVFGIVACTSVTNPPQLASSSMVKQVSGACGCYYCSAVLVASHSRLVPQLYRFMSIGYLCQFLSVVLMVMHLLVFALNGTGLLFLKWVGQLADVGSQAVLAGMLVLLVRDCYQ